MDEAFGQPVLKSSLSPQSSLSYLALSGVIPMRQPSLFKRLGGTSFILTVLAAGLVPLVVEMPSTAAPTVAGMRSIFLNGTDISSARNQELKNVDIHINENGDLFIVAPHYQVNEEDTYVPLSKYVEGMGGPKHKPPQAVPNEVSSPKAVPTAPEPGPGPGLTTSGTPGADGLMPKAGSPTSAPAGAVMPTASAAPDAAPEAKADEPPELPEDEVSGTKEP